MPKRTPPPESDDDARLLGDSSTQPWFKLYEDKLAELAEDKANGAADTDLELAEIVENAPQDMRGSLVARFRALVAEKEKEKSAPPPQLTPEQEKAMELLKQHEQLFMAHLLSEKTLEKIRRAMLMNPFMVQEILSLGEKLQREGMSLKPGARGAEITEIAVQATRSQEKPKEGRDR